MEHCIDSAGSPNLPLLTRKVVCIYRKHTFHRYPCKRATPQIHLTLHRYLFVLFCYFFWQGTIKRGDYKKNGGWTKNYGTITDRLWYPVRDRRDLPQLTAQAQGAKNSFQLPAVKNNLYLVTGGKKRSQPELTQRVMEHIHATNRPVPTQLVNMES